MAREDVLNSLFGEDSGPSVPLSPFADVTPLQKNVSGPAVATLNSLFAGYGDEAMGNIFSLFPGSGTADEEAAILRRHADAFKADSPFIKGGIDVAGAIVSPLNKLGVGMLRKVKNAGTAVKMGANLADNVALGALSASGEADQNRGDAAIEGGATSGLFSLASYPVAKIAGNLVKNAGETGEKLKFGAFGLGARDINNSLKGGKFEYKATGDVPIATAFKDIEKEGLVDITKPIHENITSLQTYKDDVMGQLDTLLADADVAMAGKPARVTFRKGKDFVDTKVGLDKEQAQAAYSDLAKSLGSQGKVNDTLTGMNKTKKAMYGVAYKDQNPFKATLEKAAASDYRAKIENQVDQLVAQGKLPMGYSGLVRDLNSKWSKANDVQSSFFQKVGADYGEDAVDEIVKRFNTTGPKAIGSLVNPAFSGSVPAGISGIAASLLNTQRGRYALGDMLDSKGMRGLDALTDAVSPKFGLSAGRLIGGQYDDSESANPLDPEILDANAASMFDALVNSESQQQFDLSKKKVEVEEMRSLPFDTKVKKIAANLQTDPQHLFDAMNFETGGTFDAQQENAAGSGATGLIQFMPSTALGLIPEAKTKEAAINVLKGMNEVEQLDYVEKYLKPFAGKLNSLDDVYMAILWPKAVGKDPDYVLFEKGTKAWLQNKGLDVNKDGKITKAEATTKVRNFA